MDGCEVRQIAGRFQDFCVADGTFLVNDEGAAFGDAFHIEDKIIIEGAVGGRNFFIKVAEEGEVKVLFFLVFPQGEDGVDADGEDLGVGLVVKGYVVAGAA